MMQKRPKRHGIKNRPKKKIFFLAKKSQNVVKQSFQLHILLNLKEQRRIDAVFHLTLGVLDI